MTIQEAVADGWSTTWGPSRDTAKIGDTIRMRKCKPFPYELKIVGWDRWGPRFEPMSDICRVTLQSQEDLDFFRRQER